MDGYPRLFSPRLGARSNRRLGFSFSAIWLVTLLVAACGGGDGGEEANMSNGSGASGDAGSEPDPSQDQRAETSAALWISGDESTQRLARGGEADTAQQSAANAAFARAASSDTLATPAPVTPAPRAGVLWSGATTLRRVSLDRSLAPAQETARLELSAEQRTRGAARADDERLWAVLRGDDGNRRLAAFDAGLNERWSVDLSGEPQRLVVAGAPQAPNATNRAADATPHAERSVVVWSLAGGRITGYDDQGQVDKQWSVNEAQSLAQTAADRLLVGNPSGVTIFDASGAQQQRIDLNEAVAALRADSRDGAWAVLETGRLVHLGSDGAETRRIDPVDNGVSGAIEAVAGDPRSGALWLVAGDALYRAPLEGELVREQTVAADIGRVTDLTLLADTFDPRLTIEAPAQNAALATDAPLAEFEYRDAGTGVRLDSLALALNDAALQADCPAMADAASPESPVACTLPAQADGEYTLSARVTDGAGRESSQATTTFTLDTQPPTITLANGLEGTITNAESIDIAGRVSEPAIVRVDGDMVSLDIDHRFNRSVELASDGTQTILVAAEDEAGNTRERRVTVRRDTVAPSPVATDKITTAEGDSDDTTVVEGAAGSVDGGTTVVITNPDTDATARVTAAEDGSFRAVVTGEFGDTFALRTEDVAGNTSAKRPIVAEMDVPPDPAAVAPEPPATGNPPMAKRVEFLYSGDNPIQRGVAEGTIEVRRVAVVRGTVRDREGNPMPGVEITVLDHPELGRTVSRADGRFDLAVNGGGVITIEYNRDGFLPVQRTVKPQWEGWAHAEPVVMAPLSDKVTTIDLTDTSQAFQVARGPGQEDEAGKRQATLLFPAGVTAEITRPDGTKEQLSQLDVRATEYTVGENGPEATPGDLPPTSAYTYAVELSVDQAMEQGIKVEGKDVTFSEPVPFYVKIQGSSLFFYDFVHDGPPAVSGARGRSSVAQ